MPGYGSADNSGYERSRPDTPPLRFTLGNALVPGNHVRLVFLTEKQSVLNHPAMDNE
jgi:hypothetical protein